MTDFDDTFTRLADDPHASKDARVFARIGGSEAIAFFRAGSTDHVADALLRYEALPAAKQDPDDLAQRAEHCRQALPGQGIPGYVASGRVTKGLFFVVVAAVVFAAGWVVVSLFTSDPSLDSQRLIPQRYVMNPFEEILLLAPTVLILIYALFHMSVLWRARTHGRAVLRWATGDESVRRLGIPVASPFNGIMSSWELLKFCTGGVLMMYGVLVVFYFAIGKEGIGPSLAPVALLCALPTIAAHLLSGAGSRIAQRREALVTEHLYRAKDSSSDTTPSLSELDEESRDPEDGDDRNQTDSHSGDAEWKTGFSADARPADHLVDPDRRER